MYTFLIFFFILGVAGFCIWGLLSFVANTYGGRSPLKVLRTYRISLLQYLLSGDQLSTYPFAILSIVMFRALFIVKVGREDHPWLVYFVLILFFVAMVAVVIFHTVLAINYWKFMKGVSLTFNPEDHTLNLDVQGKEITIRDGDLEKITLISNNSRLRFGYFIYYLKGGEHFILPDKMPGLWAIDAYFKKTPTQYLYQVFPYIK